MIRVRDVGAELLAQHRAVPPLPAQPGREYSWRLAQLEFERWRFRIRRPTTTTEGMIVCSSIAGAECLAPAMSGRLRFAFDARMSADDGDLVLIRWTDEYVERLLWHLENSASAAWRERWIRVYAPDGVFANVAIKVLRHGDGKHWITWNQGGVPLVTNGVVLGVCRHAEDEHGRPLGGSYGAAQRFARQWANNLMHVWRT